MPQRFPPSLPDISACGSTKSGKNKPTKKVAEAKEIPTESKDSSGILELLPRFELGTSSLPTATTIFFTYFSFIYSRFYSISFAFQHSLQPVFPYIPRLSVVRYVVRNRCGTYAFRSGLKRHRSKKVAKVKLVCLKRPQANRDLRRWIAPVSTMRILTY